MAIVVVEVGVWWVIWGVVGGAALSFRFSCTQTGDTQLWHPCREIGFSKHMGALEQPEIVINWYSLNVWPSHQDHYFRGSSLETCFNCCGFAGHFIAISTMMAIGTRVYSLPLVDLTQHMIGIGGENWPVDPFRWANDASLALHSAVQPVTMVFISLRLGNQPKT